MDQSCPRHEVRRIFQQFLQAVFSIIQLFNIIGVYVCSFSSVVVFLIIKNLFNGFHQSRVVISIPKLHPGNDVATLDLKLYFFLKHKVNPVHYSD